MNNNNQSEKPLPKPQIGGGSIPIFSIWLIPILAAVIGLWLVVQSVMQSGTDITVRFQTADGLEAGKTKVKYRDVDVGTVRAIDILEDLRGVSVSIEINKAAEPYLTNQARFWVVRPRIGAQGISGLGTLVSGAYIEVDPGKAGTKTRDFVGLELPPVITTDDPGREFVLVTNKLGSYTTGSPIYYRGLKVGEVLGHEMAENRKEFRVFAFIHAPHDELVRAGSKFWNVSGINVSVDSDGMDLNIESLQALALGGIAFDTVDDLAQSQPSPELSKFRLYDREEDIASAAFTRTFRWIAYFDGSVRGLQKGAPVEFKGIQIGRVVDVHLEVDREQASFKIPVLLDIEPERVQIAGEDPVLRFITREQHIEGMQRLIDRGMKARMKSGNLLTGQLLVDLDFYPDDQALLRGDGNVPEIPTLPSTVEEITRSLTAFLDKVQALPLGELTTSLTNTVKGVEALVNSEELPRALGSLDKALVSLDSLMTKVEQDMAPEVQATLAEAHETLKTIRQTIDTNSPLRYDLETTLEELANAARSIRLLAEYLESNPNALIYGKSGGPAQ